MHRFGQDESCPSLCAKVRLLGEAEVQIFSQAGGKWQALRGGSLQVAALRNLEQLTSFANDFYKSTELPSIGICVF